MTSTLQRLAEGNTRKPVTSTQKVRVRQNTELFNMLLNHLHSKRLIGEFVDPYKSCKKTYKAYEKQAVIFSGVGIKNIVEYDTKLFKKAAYCINELPFPYVPITYKDTHEQQDIMSLISNAICTKELLNKIQLDDHNKINFSLRSLNFSEVIYMISRVNSLYKLTRKHDETLRLFLLRNTTEEFIYQMEKTFEDLNADIHMRKEGDVNRLHFFTLRSLVISIINIQRLHFSGIEPDLEMINIHEHIWVDRILSSSLDL